MRSRHPSTQRFFAWLAFVAMGLASLLPVVSQLGMARPMAMGMDMPAMADMGPDCPGHMAHADAPAKPALPDGHGAMPLDACGYCSFMAHFAGLPSLPVVVMRAPPRAADAPLAAFPTRARTVAWWFDAAPRGPPALT